MEVLRVVCKFIFSVFMRVRVYGAENMPDTGGIIVAANHQSIFDMFMIGYRLKRYLKWMAKEELFRNRLVAKCITAWGAYPVNRSIRDVSAARTTFEMLEKGEAVGIFPQGTRTKGIDRSKKARHGIAKFAVEADVPVLPVAIWGNIRLFGRVNVRFGEPVILPKPEPGMKYTNDDYKRMSQDILEGIYALMEVPKSGNN